MSASFTWELVEILSVPFGSDLLEQNTTLVLGVQDRLMWFVTQPEPNHSEPLQPMQSLQPFTNPSSVEVSQSSYMLKDYRISYN
ncbi:uncharacterized [Tachysurus ichikawai]